MKKLLIKQFYAALILTFVSGAAHAFPDMIRHGYTNCTACHVSPSGGGVLNAYGRSLSKELISTWSGKNEEGLLHFINTEKVDDWLAIGGDFRGAQVHQENETVKRGKWISMQAGVEVALTPSIFTFDIFAGQFRPSASGTEFKEYAPRYYAMVKPRDELYIKLGRFLPNFGLNSPDHIIATRGPLMMGYGMERDTAEVSWLGEDWNIIGGYYQTPKNISADSQTGITGTVTYTFLGNFKTGLQFLSEKDDVQTRKITGALGYLGWTKDIGTLFEIDSVTVSQVTQQVAGGPERKGVALLHRSSFEVFKGFHVVVLNSYLQSDVDAGSTKTYRFGPGIQWFPRPHFDVQAFWTREQASSLKEGDYAWLVLHYYL